MGGLTCEYGLVANISRTHRFLRTGCKVWVREIKGAQVGVIGMTRGGRNVCTWVNRSYLSNYRCAWLPEHKRTFEFSVFLRGEKNKMIEYAEEMNSELPAII